MQNENDTRNLLSVEHIWNGSTEPTFVQDSIQQTEAPSDSTPCILDYSTLPVILLNSLPLSVQRLICNRLGKSTCPLFVLVTSKDGLWSLVQLTFNPTNVHVSRETSPGGYSHRSTTDSELHIGHCTEYGGGTFNGDSSLELGCSTSDITFDYIPSLRVKLDEHTVACFSHNRVSLELPTNGEGKCNWNCPFCGAHFVVDAGISNHSVLGGHLRLHLEIRCCIDCCLLLPNNSRISTQDLDSSLQSRHQCDQYVNKTKNNSDCAVDETFAYSSSVNKVKGKREIVIFNRNGCSYFHCEHCEVDFPDSAKFQQHLKNVHSGNRYRCPDCHVDFSTKGNLTKHILQVHNRIPTLRCHICHKTMSNKSNAQRHMKSVHSDVTDPFNLVQDEISGVQQSAAPPMDDFASTFNCDDSVPPEVSSSLSALINPSLHPVLQPGEASTISSKTDDSSRGFYLYLADPDVLKSSATADVPCDTQLNYAIEAPTACSTLMAEVRMTPCRPTSPSAHYGPRGSSWHQQLVIPNYWTEHRNDGT